jgi:hypothetical protein
VAEYLGIVEALRELDRLCAPVEGCIVVLGEGAKPQHLAVPHRELVSGRELLEQSHGLPAGLRRLSHSTRTPEKGRESAQRVPLGTPVAKSSVALDCAVLRLSGLVCLVGQVALERAALEELRLRLQRLFLCEPQRPRVLGGGLQMRAVRSGLSRRLRRELEHRLPVTGRLGVVGEPRKLRSTG